LQIQLRSQAIATETPGCPFDGNWQCVRHVGAPAIVLWIAGHRAPGDYKEKFPRDFQFPVTIPYLFAGELPAELKGVPHLEVCVQSYNPGKPDAEPVKDVK
jgi:hypothetical protein